MNAWDVLAIEETGDERAIKRAYAKKLKLTRPEDDAEGFQRLRDAYAFALRMAAYLRDHDSVDDSDRAPPDEPQTAPANPPASHDGDVSPVGVALFHDANWQPTAHPVDERDVAERLWRAFLEQASFLPRYHLREIAASDAMLSLDVRDYFELYAVAFCASDACDDELREAIAAHFRWNEDVSRVERELPHAAEETLARLRAAESYRQFQAAARGDQAAAALLADTPGRAFPRTWNRSFVLGMREHLTTLRWRHPEMLHFKLDQDVVETWTGRVQGRCCYFQTLRSALVSGFVLWVVATAILESYGLARNNLSMIFLASVALALAAGIGMERLAARTETADWANRLLHEWRYQPLVQFGWIALLAVLGPIMLGIAPNDWLLLPVSLLALVCVAVACLANSVALNKWSFGLSALFGAALAHGGSAGDYRFVGSWALATATLQLFYRGGADLWAWRGTPDALVTRLRLVWLAGAVLFLLFAQATVLVAYGAALWMLAGMLLSRPTVHFLVAIAVLGVSTLLPSTVFSQAIHTPPYSTLLCAMIGIATFMAVNMKRAKAHQHLFA